MHVVGRNKLQSIVKDFCTQAGFSGEDFTQHLSTLIAEILKKTWAKFLYSLVFFGNWCVIEESITSDKNVVVVLQVFKLQILVLLYYFTSLILAFLEAKNTSLKKS